MAGLRNLRPAEVAAWLATPEGAGAQVLDVREPWEVELAALAVTTHRIPMGELPARIGELDPARPVACLCHHGVRSMHVAMWLRHQGHGDLVNIAGGIDAWSAELDPSVPRY